MNTVHSRVEADPHEYLQSYADLARWARDGGLVSAREYRQLAETARSRPQQANRVLRRAVELRELMYKLFMTVARDGETVPGITPVPGIHVAPASGPKSADARLQ